MWIQLPDEDLQKIESVEYYWTGRSYPSPIIPKGKSETAFLIEYLGYGAIPQAMLKIRLFDGTEYEIFYPFRSIWKFGELNSKDLNPYSTIITF